MDVEGDLFEKQPAMRNTVAQSRTIELVWANGELTPEFRQPFEMLANRRRSGHKTLLDCLPAAIIKKSPRQDSNLRQVVNSHLLYQLSYRGLR